MCVAMAESAPISLVTISCTMLASGPSSSRIVAAMWAKTDNGKHAIVSLCALMKSSSCVARKHTRSKGATCGWVLSAVQEQFTMQCFTRLHTRNRRVRVSRCDTATVFLKYAHSLKVAVASSAFIHLQLCTVG